MLPNLHRFRVFIQIVAIVALLLPSLALAAGVHVLFDLETPTGGPFPSDRFAIFDSSHLTGLRVNLPQPNCATRPSDCQDIDVINTLDGFNNQPRLSIQFDGLIDVTSVNSSNVFLVSLGNTVNGAGGGKVIGINQVVWDPATQTLHAESDQFLDQHTRYALIVTSGVQDLLGDPVEPSQAFERFRHDLNFGQTKDPVLKAYRKSLLDALAELRRSGLYAGDVVAASVFTTQSTTAILEKIRDQIKGSTPAAANFNLGPGGSSTIFPLSTVTGIVSNLQISTAGPLTSVPVLAFAALTTFPGVGALAFGKYASPDYETADKFIPAVGTRTGVPAVQFTSDVYFNLFLPAGTPPSGGWPVAIFGHGFGDSKNNSPFVVASTMAANGIATIAINVVGHGRGPLSTLTVNRSVANGGPVTFLAGGRGIDQNGNGTIDSTEGSSAVPPRGIISSRDGLRQTVVDLMQLTRLIETGGIPGLDPTRIYYFGQSFGGIYGTIFLGVESSVRVGVPNVPGGAIIEIVRLSPAFRPLLGAALGARTPSLLNGGPSGFTENIPLRDLPPVTNAVVGAMEIQEVIDNTEWVSQSGNPVAYAPHIRKDPLDSVPEKSVIIQFAKGDQTVPNPTATAIIRAGDLADRATYFRNDLARAVNLALPVNPHTFLTGILTAAGSGIAREAQQQIATFFTSDGAVTIDPDSLGLFPPPPAAPVAVFETPVVPPLPEVLNF